ncbi:MAG TPA: DUF3175 domain-containing protein [Stellaceae bacterium]|nr:DUF3175 domain-containing protein [Stellaceae bacterium]
MRPLRSTSAPCNTSSGIEAWPRLEGQLLVGRSPSGTPDQSAMWMLTFYINRAGKNLPASQKRVLARAKDQLRKAFGRA